MTAILVSFVIALALNGAFFAVAAIRKTDVVTDLSYSLTFAVLAVISALHRRARAGAARRVAARPGLGSAAGDATCSGGSCG